MVLRSLVAGLIALGLASPIAAQEAKAKPDYTRKEDVIYGRKDGVSLTMDVFTPSANPNGAGVILCVSMRFRSSKEMMAFFHPATTVEFLKRGYTVFAVVHGSQPKFTIPEIVD